MAFKRPTNRFFLIKRDTRAHTMFSYLFNYKEHWFTNRECIESLLGCDMDDNLGFYTNALLMKEPPSHLSKSFGKKVAGYHRAHFNSKIHKEWVKLAFELGLDAPMENKVASKLGLDKLEVDPRQSVFFIKAHRLGDGFYGFVGGGNGFAPEFTQELGGNVYMRLIDEYKKKELERVG